MIPVKIYYCALIKLLFVPSLLSATSEDVIRKVDWPTTKFKTMDCIITTDANRDWFGQIAVITGFHLDKIHGFAYRVLISENINQKSRWYRYVELEKIAAKVENCDLLN